MKGEPMGSSKPATPGVYLVKQGNAEITTLSTMTTATVEIKNNIALDLLRHLESIGMLRVLGSKSVSASPKLSEKFAGSLSKESVHKMQQELNSMRNEWE